MKNKADHYRDGYSGNGSGLHYDEPGSYREDLSGSGMDMPSAVFLPSGKNSERGSI